jgi:hypothetical protein
VSKNDALAELEFGHREEPISLSPFQMRVAAVPESWSVALTGGRGGGKSYTIAILIMRHLVKYGAMGARVLFVRQTHQGCEDFVLICRELFMKVWGPGVKYNANNGIWSGFPGGGFLEINQISSYAEYGKFQGRSYTMICCDEIGQFVTDELINLLRSNLRGALEVPKRMIVASNPAGSGHSWVYRKHILKASPWHPYELDGETWVTCPSTFEGNIFIDREKYLRDLTAACAHDSELARAFISGDWDVVRGGAFFAHCLDAARVMFPAWRLPEGVTGRAYVKPRPVRAGKGIMLAEPDVEDWNFWITMDWGYSAPCIVYLCGRSPGATVDGRWYPRGSVLLLDEISTAHADQLHIGSEMAVADVALLIKRMCARYGIPPAGTCDDACGIRNQDGVSVVDTFATNGVYFREAGKGSRIGGWTHMREMLNNAGKLDKAGLYVSDACRYFWATAPFIGRSHRNPEDLDGQLDHGVDAARYAIIQRHNPRPQREF